MQSWRSSVRKSSRPKLGSSQPDSRLAFATCLACSYETFEGMECLYPEGYEE